MFSKKKKKTTRKKLLCSFKLKSMLCFLKLHYSKNCEISSIIIIAKARYYFWTCQMFFQWYQLTHCISSSRCEEIAGLGESLDKLGDALSVALTSPQRPHHGGQDSLHNACEKLRAQSLATSTRRLRGGGGGSWRGSGCGLCRWRLLVWWRKHRLARLWRKE